MKKRFLLLALPLLCGLVGCDGGSKYSHQELVDMAADAFPMLVDFSSGKELAELSRVRDLDDYQSLLGLNSLTWQNTEFDLSWTALPAEKWTVKSYPSDESRTKFMPIYGEEQFNCSLELTISVKGDSAATHVMHWDFKSAIHTKPDLTGYTYTSIQDLMELYIEKPAQIPAKIYTFGYITCSMEVNDTHLYSGAFIQDGAYGLELYAGKLDDIWLSVGFEPGDLVMVAGVLSPYNGLMECKPDLLESGTSYEEAATVAEPVVNDLNDVAWSNDTISIYQNTLVRVNNLTYVSCKTLPQPGVHGEITLKNEAGVEIPFYVNYHIGTDAMNAMKAAVASWVPNVTKFNFYGLCSVFTNVQLFPIFGLDSITLL